MIPVFKNISETLEDVMQHKNEEGGGRVTSLHLSLHEMIHVNLPNINRIK